METTAELTVYQRAANALSKAETEQHLIALAQESKAIVAVVDAESRDFCHDSMMKLKNMRVMVQKRGKKGREEAQEYSKTVIAIEKELVALIEPEESRLEALRDEWDAAREAEKEAKIQAEIKRVQDIQARITELRSAPAACASASSAVINDTIALINSTKVDDSFAEFEQEAAQAKSLTLASLNGLFAAAVDREAEAERVRLGMIELAKLKAEQAERERVADEERKRQEQADHDRRVAEARAHAEEIAALQKELDAQKAENDRIAEEQRKAVAEETGRLAAERARFEAEQEVARKANEPKPPPLPAARPKMAKTPSREEIVEAVARAFDVHPDIAAYWLGSIRWDRAA